MATRADVAALAGVSESTVSYVLSGKRRISAPTRERVEQAMATLGYTKNPVASSLAGGRSNVIAWHYPIGEHGLSLTAFEYLSAASAAAAERHHHLLLWTGPLEDSDALSRLVATQLVDGVILTEVVMDDPRVAALRAGGLPLTLVGRPRESEDLAFVDADFERMASLALDHLAGLGHERLVFLDADIELPRIGYGPVVRITDALTRLAAERGLHLDVLSAGTTADDGRELVRAERLPPATAVLGFNPLTLAGVMDGVAAQGRSVPDDLSVLALGVTPATAALTSPPLATICVPSAVMGQRAVAVLGDEIDGRGTRQELVAPTLHPGASTGPAPRG
ncbi:LacI family transcriptional regulator [Salana multivorans]|uniref:LacI family transcriptional regulator n=1 Tax=Salana multivorans TaxID=120377 RepID=A0A3N2D2B8_9MICO|nr:LacI family DNA-binding transcriptional regulator [Salana multivorans]ROR93901.1 LacI family transcriptional regulator [Salana multivorans]